MTIYDPYYTQPLVRRRGSARGDDVPIGEQGFVRSGQLLPRLARERSARRASRSLSVRVALFGPRRTLTPRPFSGTRNALPIAPGLISAGNGVGGVDVAAAVGLDPDLPVLGRETAVAAANLADRDDYDRNRAPARRNPPALRGRGRRACGCASRRRSACAGRRDGRSGGDRRRRALLLRRATVARSGPVRRSPRRSRRGRNSRS